MKAFERLAIASCLVLALGGCANMTTGQAQLAGAGGGALVGAIASGGLLAPALGAVGGALVGEKLAEDDR